MSTSVLGSIVKPASLLMLYDTGTRKMGDRIYDEPLYFKGTPEPKASYMNMGSITDQEALKLSSNVYFYKSFMDLAQMTYVPYGPLDIDPKYFDIVRKYYSLFGLGVSTGIEMEDEEIGFKGEKTDPGFFLDMANGQYDTNTNLQATQYVSTIANGGRRYKIQYLKSVHESGDIGSAGEIIYSPTPTVLNEIPMSQEEIEHVKGGMVMAASESGGTITDYIPVSNEHGVEIAGKSGTAETFYYDEKTGSTIKNDTTSALGFAPVDDPEIALSVLWPYSEMDEGLSYYESPKVAAEVMDKYYDVKEK
jgi:cell division protein FtsI/penicillin-binding protein 2